MTDNITHIIQADVNAEQVADLLGVPVEAFLRWSPREQQRAVQRIVDGVIERLKAERIRALSE
jgi:hypothetical protein